MIKKLIGLTAISALLVVGCERASNIKSKSSSAANVAALPAGVEPALQAQAAKPRKYLLHINDATNAQLSQVPDITPEIIDLVSNLRPFLDVVEFDEELDRLGVSSKKRAALYEHIFMHVDANNSPFEELLVIPNVSKKNAFDIVDARPYSGKSDLMSQLEKSYKRDEAEKILKYFKITKPQK